MPVQYTSIIDEHLAVRRAAGIFDIAHMGEVFVTGPGAARFLNRVLTNNIEKLLVGEGQYTLMCHERGGVIDDLYAYRLGEDRYLLIINASRIDPDVAWLERQERALGGGQARVENVSGRVGAVAVQGPRVAGFIDACFETKGCLTPTELRKNQIGTFFFLGREVYAARTGYTGEDGFEVVAPSDLLEAFWNKALQEGQPHGLQPAGLGARDTLRTEMGYPLYGHELDEDKTPIEAGAGFFVSLDKGDFIGRDVLADQKSKGVSRKCVAFKMTDKSAPPRPHYPIWAPGQATTPIGEVASGTLSPSLGVGIGMGYVPVALSKVGTPLEIEIRNKKYPAIIAGKPLLKRA